MGVYRRWVNVTRRVVFAFPNVKYQPWCHDDDDGAGAARLLDFWISQMCRGELVAYVDDAGDAGGAAEDLYYSSDEWPNEYARAMASFAVMAKPL